MWKTIIQLAIDFFPYWTVAHIFQGANFSMPTPCSILSFIIGRLQKTWGRFEESYLRQGFEDFLTKYIGTNRLFGKARGSVTSVKSRGVLNHPSRLFILVPIFCFLINCKVCYVS